MADLEPRFAEEGNSWVAGERTGSGAGQRSTKWEPSSLRKVSRMAPGAMSLPSKHKTCVKIYYFT